MLLVLSLCFSRTAAAAATVVAFAYVSVLSGAVDDR